MSSGYGAAAAVVGTELQGWAALLEKWAQEEAYRKEAGQQDAFRQQAGGIFDKRLQGAGAQTAGKQMAAGAAGREKDYASVNATPLSVQAAPLSGGQNARNSAYAGLLGGQRAKLGGYGDWLQKQYMSNQQTNRDLGQVENFASGNAAVFPLHMYAAQHSMDDLAAIGQAISSIGGGSTNFGSLFSSPTTSKGNLQGAVDLPDTGSMNDLGASQSTYALG